MAIAIPGTHDSNYYSTAALHGDYQFLTLEEIEDSRDNITQ